jgi:hypothetical protein
LISLYGLSPIEISVRRVDPATGEKINKLRKSYEGRIKMAGIAGRNKAVSKPNELVGEPSTGALMAIPEDYFQQMFVAGKEIQTGLTDSFKKRIASALAVTSTELKPELTEQFRATLVEEPPPKAKVDPNGKRPVVDQSPAAPVSRTESPPRAVRPQRPSAKRGYDDSSFSGYAEGFGDDDEASDGYGRPKKKQRKVSNGLLNSAIVLHCNRFIDLY